MKIKVNTDDNLSLNETLELHQMIIVSRFVFHKGSKYYHQVFLDKCFFKLKMLEYNRNDAL